MQATSSKPKSTDIHFQLKKTTIFLGFPATPLTGIGLLLFTPRIFTFPDMTLARGLSCLEAPHPLCFPYPACNADTAYGIKSEPCFSSWPIGLVISANTIPCWHCGRLWPKSLTSQQKQRKILLYGPNHHYSGISNHKCDWSAWRQGKRELGLPDLMSLGKQVVFLGWI